MTMTCPVSLCKATNDPAAEFCASCGTPLQGYARLLSHPAVLFNAGLVAAQAGKLGRARDLFASVVNWVPADLEARNALALACLRLGDHAEARHQWELVLARSASNALAVRGLEALDGAASAPKPPQQAPARERHAGKKIGRAVTPKAKRSGRRKQQLAEQRGGKHE